MEAPVKYVKMRNAEQGKDAYIPESSARNYAGQGWQLSRDQRTERFSMVFDRGGRGHFFVPSGQESEYDSSKYGVAGVDKHEVTVSAGGGDDKKFKKDISEAPGYAAVGWPIHGSQEVSPELLGEGTYMDPGMQQRIDAVGQEAYQDDPMLDAAMRVGEELRQNQAQGLKTLADLTVGRDTIAEQQGDTAAAQLSGRLGSFMGGSQERAALRGFKDASAELAGDTAREVVAERGRQMGSLGQGADMAINSVLNAGNVRRARSANRMNFALAKQQRVNDLTQMARDISQKKMLGDISNAAAQAQWDAAILGTSPMPNYAPQVAQAITGAVSTGTGIAGDIYASRSTPAAPTPSSTYSTPPSMFNTDAAPSIDTGFRRS